MSKATETLDGDHSASLDAHSPYTVECCDACAKEGSVICWFDVRGDANGGLGAKNAVFCVYGYQSACDYFAPGEMSIKLTSTVHGHTVDGLVLTHLKHPLIATLAHPIVPTMPRPANAVTLFPLLLSIANCDNGANDLVAWNQIFVRS